jgi:Zn-dependent protease with chaperone function
VEEAIEATAESAPPADQAIFFDGTSSRRRDVTLVFADALQIMDADKVLASWAYADIRRVDAPPDVLRLRVVNTPSLARLEIRDARLEAECRARCPRLDRATTDGRRGAWTVVALGLAATASVIGIIFYGLPLLADRLTPLVPSSFDRRVGQVAERQIALMVGNKVCTAPEGVEALAVLVNKVRTAADLPADAAPIVLSTPIANAFALPGGQVVIFSGLLEKAENADEVAGVLGHEFGHVKHRDSMRNLLHTGGLSFLAGMMFGDVTGGGALIFASRTLITASHSRQVETDADTYSIMTMHRLGRPTLALGNLMQRITGGKGEGLSLLANHPLTEERLARMRSEDRPATGAPLLTAEQWSALKAVCSTTRKT